MAETKTSFPMLPIAHWWGLRRKFIQSIPGVVTDNYLATVFNMGVQSARANVLPFLKSLGIIDEDGKPTERAKLWRDQKQYASVCKAILSDVYPKELLDAVPKPREDRDAAKRWFANHTGAGDSACTRMASLYTVLVEADPASQPETPKGQSPGRTRQAPAPKPRSEAQQAKPHVKEASGESAFPANTGIPQAPGVSINLQIHISADASGDQIEQIFAAMGKHIYKRA